MQKTQKIAINNESDVLQVRVQTRQIARQLGFNTIDQARISLAAGQLAQVLIQNLGERGEVIISEINNQGRVGLQVVGTSFKTAKKTPGSNEQVNDYKAQRSLLSSTLSLVDEFSFNDQGKPGASVTLIKWLTKGVRYA